MPLKWWWMLLRPVTGGRVAVWWLAWKLRGHGRNHDPWFCRHPTKAWLWEMEDGCKGLVCDWCHLLEPWTPTSLPDVATLLRTTADGRPDPDWRPQALVERYCEAWEQLDKDLPDGRANLPTRQRMSQAGSATRPGLRPTVREPVMRTRRDR